jgi:DNA-binding IclR family transcriptional regulator
MCFWSKWNAKFRRRRSFCARALKENRLLLRKQGYTVACGLLSPNINGIAAPVWSPQYQTFVIATIGLSSATYNEDRLNEEVAPHLLALSKSIRGVMETSEGYPTPALGQVLSDKIPVAATKG